MTTFDRKINQIAVRHGWSIEKQPRAAVECYIIDAATYEDTLHADLRTSETGDLLLPAPSLPEHGHLL